MNYNEYLKSSEWKNFRSKIISQCQKCYICDSAASLNVHHKTYDNLGSETESDVVVLCNECHAIHHGKLPSTKALAEEYLDFARTFRRERDMLMKTILDAKQILKQGNTQKAYSILYRGCNALSTTSPSTNYNPELYLNVSKSS